MTNTLYITRDELKDYASSIPQSNTSIDQIIDQVVATASRAVDNYTGRRFYADVDEDGIPVLSTRVFWPDGPGTLWIDDIADTSTVALAYDTAGTQTYADVWTASSYFFEPLNGIVNGVQWPATAIRTSGRFFPTYWSNRHAPIQITAQWGWPAVPDAVKTATFMTALDLLKMKDAPFGVAGFDQYGPVRARANAQVAQLLDGVYCKTVLGIA